MQTNNGDVAKNRQTGSSADLQNVFSQAFSLHQAGDFAEAERLYRQVLVHLPENVNLLCNLAIVCRDRGNPAEALAVLRRAQAVDPVSPLVLLNLGAIHEAGGDLVQAEEAYRAALRLAPGEARVMSNLGKVLQVRGKTAEALKLLERAVRLAPNYPLAWNNLGVVLSALGRNEEAIRSFDSALALDSGNGDFLFNLAGAHNALGNLEMARHCYEMTVAAAPHHASAGHMLAALAGQRSAGAPAGYVVDTFDSYAHRFDAHLTKQLEYEVPWKLRDALFSVAGQRLFANALDLGCGTGLSGQAFAQGAEKITGVDLSAGMLEKAEGKKIYHRLVREDVCAFLAMCEESFDLVIATDVFIYIGDLARVFELVRRKMADNAYFVFSIERAKPDCPDYELRVSGRYAQAVGYIERLAKKYDFVVERNQAVGIRKEQGNWIEGNVFVLRKGEKPRES